MTYESINPQYEYLDLSRHHLTADGVLSVLDDLLEDTMIKHVNLSYNILLEEWSNPRKIEVFFKGLRKRLVRNTHLVALDLAGNHLFAYHPHPSNEHVKMYEKELTEILKASTITHIDVSYNNMTGNTGREVAGLMYFCTKYMVQAKAFQCRGNHLHSQGIQAVCSCLGIYSTLTYLDVSDNLIGVDPLGKRNRPDGMPTPDTCLRGPSLAQSEPAVSFTLLGPCTPSPCEVNGRCWVWEREGPRRQVPR